MREEGGGGGGGENGNDSYFGWHCASSCVEKSANYLQPEQSTIFNSVSVKIIVIGFGLKRADKTLFVNTF